MSDRSATALPGSDTEALAKFRRSIGRWALFVAPVCGRTEHGLIVGADHRMVYVDYGYPNPIRPELGNAIATHPRNLHLKYPAGQGDACPTCLSPVLSDVVC
ncbi:hypothetical protein FB390_1463 [Nocardia bhagyanarayanae]|uniref:Uncharacterized protein n=2 Tax=Nocardia bhagyanarayanae TaxID=1215925 RepID=A0A543F7X0_9NOCA|nr:hypothetical protein FB390_1463 [Nocardia bhagyanarayanae]